MNWKPMIDYPDLYEVSDTGEIRNAKRGNILKQYCCPKGYKNIATKIGGRQGKAVLFRVHRKVAECFIDNPEGKPFVNHIDGVKDNNHVSNLEWCTASENNQHALDMGLKLPTSQKDNQKLTDDQVEYIRSVYVSHSREYGSRALARKFGVHKSTITRVQRQGYKT